MLDESGNYEMALVYYNRGSKHFPRSQEFKDGIKKTEKKSNKTGLLFQRILYTDFSFFFLTVSTLNIEIEICVL